MEVTEQMVDAALEALNDRDVSIQPAAEAAQRKAMRAALEAALAAA